MVSHSFHTFPCEEYDVGTQRCRLDTTTLKQLNCQLGSFLQICTDNSINICSAWPCKMSSEHSHCLHINNTVTVLTDHRLHAALSRHKICVLKSSYAKCINVKVIVKNVESYEKWRSFSSVRDQLQMYALHCLRNMCIKTSSVVSLKEGKLANMYEILYIVVNELSTIKETEGGVVTENTSVIIDSVQSEERFMLTTEKRLIPVGGLGGLMESLCDLIQLPLKYGESMKHLQLPYPRGVLLRGPPGCGKTSLVRHIAHLVEAALVIINGPEIIGPHPGESEEKIRSIFQKAVRLGREGPCILFIDEIDALCPKRGKSSSSHDSRVTSALMSSMDTLQETEGLVVIGATNRPASLDPALRRPGRFDREVLMNVPNKEQRRDILGIHGARLPLGEDVDFDVLADFTIGYVGADLASLCNKAAYLALEETKACSSKDENFQGKSSVCMYHFNMVLKTIQPSLQKGTEGVVDFRPVLWEDIGGLRSVKTQIKQAVEWPLKHPEAFKRMGLPQTKGVLLYGPPGCCKTTLVRAAATSTRSSFLSLSGAQLYSPFVGDSEKLVTEVFQKARAMAPCILFLDEVDSIVGKRSEGSSHRGVQERLLSTILNEMDGIGIRLDDKVDSSQVKEFEGEMETEQNTTRKDHQSVDNRKILVVAATNRPDLVDEAILRPGRIDRIVYVPPPDKEARSEILKIHAKKMPIDDVSLVDIAEKTNFYTGADLENLCKEAAMLALSETLDADTVTGDHFQKALTVVKPSLNPELIEKYKKLTWREAVSITQKNKC